ncbi:Uncharacterised protein [Slackia heliotrinireducens]|uniref:Uncharacterized protein n=1 Tax=Slackia heliotrinireducens (strain ATCC 29202 / DSM 20476 / NCTC 11029 / RHS 1) TaxID=471855 RepID=C7N169_SLAHD|nr:hypothetical protein [Slackia heliotrinireducens]ACV23291.1 hypothetical protein Shel_22810 [Slackia heliotrinireducens DSM 20476]VEH02470.1 Uncharacterised protein [Slackia heliotrinireducens]
MTQDDFFDLTPVEDFDSYDPLADTEDEEFDLEAPAESGMFLVEPGEFPTVDELASQAEALQQAPAAQRIATLFDHMERSRKILLGILEMCDGQVQPNELVISRIEKLKANNKSVYTPDNMCMMLVRAGALRRVTQDGTDYEDIEDTLEPKRVVIDGVEYLEPVQAPQICWLTTPEGSQVVAADQPRARLRELLENEPQYRHVFRTVLEMCAPDGGTTQKALSAALDNDPALMHPRMYAMRFAERLAQNDALEWRDNAWRITDIGSEGLDIIAELDAAEQADD